MTEGENNAHTGNNEAGNPDAKNALIQMLRGSKGEEAFKLVESVSDFLRHAGREAARQRQQHYIEPFKFDQSDVKAFDNAVRTIFGDSHIDKKPFLTATLVYKIGA